jgi:hypothetical protein
MPEVDGADEPHVVTGRLERGLDKIRGGRFAARAGDPDHEQAVGRITVKAGGQAREG